MKPLIGLTPLFCDKECHAWMRSTYRDLLVNAGAIPVMLTFDTNPQDLHELVLRLDGVVFTGGVDINPTFYGEEAQEFTEKDCPVRDEFERALYKACQEVNLPIFGICRGCQLINVMYGGTLFQDLPSQHPSPVAHKMEEPYDAPAHEVNLVEGSPLQELIQKPTLKVNSIHHQGIAKVAPGLKPMAYAPDGLVEALYDPQKPWVWGVQWHPEYAFHADDEQLKLMHHFVQCCTDLTRSTCHK